MTRLLALLVAGLLCACAGDVDNNTPGDGPQGDGGPPPVDGPRDHRFKEGQPPPTEGGPPPGPCDPFEQARLHSCAGGQSCPKGLQPAALGGKPCGCYVPCDPAQGQLCQPAECGRVCVQLTDSQGNPLPNMGACVEDTGTGEGEPCTPACKIGLYCVAFTSTVSYCRKACTGPADCPGYKMVCVPLQSPAQNVCVPGGATVGPKQGESCAGANNFCVQGLICAPGSETCLEACEPGAGTCGPKTCAKIVDPGPQVTLGYGCQ